MKDNYQDIKNKLANKQAFNGNSARAEINGSLYNVYSYNTLIFSYNLDAYQILDFDNKFYSVTTSRLQNMIKKAFNIK